MSAIAVPHDYRRLSKKNAPYQTQVVSVANGAKFLALRVTAADIRVMNNALYIHVRRETRQCYIGITEQRVADRWGVGNGYRQQKRFGAAIRMHGWHAFEHYVLAVAGNRKALERAEVHAIKNAGGHKSRHTYNLSPGGDLVAENDRPLVGHHLPTGKERKFRSASDAARKLGFTNTDAASSVARGERSSTENWWFRFEEDSKAKPPKVWGENLRQSQLREMFGKPVIAINLKSKQRLRFNTQAEAESKLGINQALISASVRRKSLSAGGYIFFNEGEKEELPKLYGTAATRMKRDKAVYATNLKTERQQKFRNCTVAA